MNLGKIRDHIDHIDLEIIKLLNERMELGLRAKKFKNAIYDVERESQVLERLKKYTLSQNVIREGFVKNLFTEIMKESRKHQKTKTSLIGCQGEHGAYGEGEARNYDPDSITIPCAEIIDVFKGGSS